MTHLRQGHRELVQTLRHPQQRPDRVAQRRGLHDALQIFKKRCVALDKLPGAAALPPDLTRRQRRGIKVLQSTLDCAAGKTGDLRDRREAAPSGRTDLARGKQPASALIPLRAVRIPPLPNRMRVDNPSLVTAHAPKRNRPALSHSAARPNLRDSLIVAHVLNIQSG